MSSARIPILIALLLMVSSMGALGIVTGNDAGSGSDAPDNRDRALGLEPGVYYGNLTPAPDRTRDVDWYAAEQPSDDLEDSSTKWGTPRTTSLSCTLVNATSPRPVEVLVEEPAVPDAKVDTTVGGTDNASIGLVGPAYSDALVGVVAPEPGTIASYRFELDRTSLSEIPSAGVDPAPTSPKPIPSPCFGDDIAEGDTRDGWTFSADEDERALITFASEGDRADQLSLRDPHDQVAERVSSSGSIQVTEVDLDRGGTWQIDVEASQSNAEAQQTYVIGISILDDPEEEEEEKSPCRPHCME